MFGGDVFDYFQDSNEAKSVLYGALANQVLGDSPYANKPAVGYQGKIPEYQAVRERVETDPNRRVGGQNQRYFSDMQYAKRPDTPPPSVAEAQAKAIAGQNQSRKRERERFAASASERASASKSNNKTNDVVSTIQITRQQLSLVEVNSVLI